MTDAMTDRRSEPQELQRVYANTFVRPSHYAVNSTYEVDKCLAAWGLTGCAYKYQAAAYIARAGKKNGQPEITDLEKAIWNLQRRVEQLRKVGE